MKKYKSLLPAYIQGLSQNKYTLKQAAAATGYTTVWLCKLKKLYMQEGDAVFTHRNSGRVPANKMPDALKMQILQLYASPAYSGINFKYFRECLENYEKIKVSYTSLSTIMREAGIVSPEAHRRKKPAPVHRPRVRRDNFGDLLQIDGTPFPWFCRFGNTKKYCMVGAIDDATGKITALYITEYECLYGYLEILRQTIQTYGVPREIYSDRAAIFCATPRNKHNLTQWEQLAGLHDKHTQWQRILDDLCIRQVLAWSPEAKGRIERLWGTLQKRIPTEFYRAGVDTVEKANRFLQTYVKRFNAQFGCEPMKPESFYLPLPPEKNLDVILSAQIQRRTSSAGIISFHSYKFEVHAPRVRCRDLILHISEHGLYARFLDDENFYDVVLCEGQELDGGDTHMPQVVENIIYRYMYAYAKEVSA